MSIQAHLEYNNVLLGSINDQYKRLSTINRSDRVETFEVAIERLNLTEADLAEVKRQRTFESRVCYLSAALAAAMCLYCGATGSVAGFISSVAVIFLSSTFGNAHAFRAFQISRRELCEYKVWMANPGEWIR